MAFEVLLSASDGPEEVGVKVGKQGAKKGVDLKLLNVLCIRESLPGEDLEDRKREFQTLFVLLI